MGQEQTLSDGTKTVNVGNPLIKLELGTKLSIEAHRVESDTAAILQDTTENYSIVNLRDIARSNGIASVFHAEHSSFGDTVVKVVTKLSEPASIPRIAQDWLNEVRCMRTLDHVCYLPVHIFHGF